MSLSRLPVEQELVIFAGTDVLREFRWLPDGATGQDFTGWTARALIGPARGVALLELDTDGTDDGITLGADGLIAIRISAETTAIMDAGTLIFFLDLTDASGFILRFLRGRVTVLRELEEP